MHRISYRKRSEDRREDPFEIHLCSLLTSAVFSLLGTLARQGQPADMTAPSTEGLGVFVRQSQPDVILRVTQYCFTAPSAMTTGSWSQFWDSGEIQRRQNDRHLR